MDSFWPLGPNLPAYLPELSEVKELLFHPPWPQRCSGSNHGLNPLKSRAKINLSFHCSPAIRNLIQCDVYVYESTVLKSPGLHLDMSVRAFLGRFN
ncbi:rCG34878 [Rattus norvegicus]|uniref:RCG34878 n=1 Tax=Rattus norvegicus TaxID=10116 RepID=A6HHP8_RAT|nr:rCG34878 [Rattus norvegicus]